MPKVNLGRVKGDKGVSMRNRGEWNSTAKYLNDEHYIDFVSHNGSLWTCLATNVNVEPSDTAVEWNLAAKSIDTVYFAQASKRENIISGESASTAFGKIAKWFADIKSAAFYSVVKSLNITEEGYLMDGKTAAEAFAELNSKSIIEAGHNSNGYYRKYADGTLEMWGTNTITNVTISNTSVIYYVAKSITLPCESIVDVDITITPVSSLMLWIGRRKVTGDGYKNVNLWIYTTTAQNNINIPVSFHAFGRWK